MIDDPALFGETRDHAVQNCITGNDPDVYRAAVNQGIPMESLLRFNPYLVVEPGWIDRIGNVIAYLQDSPHAPGNDSAQRLLLPRVDLPAQRHDAMGDRDTYFEQIGGRV